MMIRLKGTISNDDEASAIIALLHALVGAAVERLRVKDYRGAIDAWEEALALAEMEGKIGIETLMGEAYFKTGEFEKAVEMLAIAVRTDPADAKCWSNLGMAYSQLGQHEEGIAALTRALELEPGEAIDWSNLAVVERRLGREEAARKSLLNAVRCDRTVRSASDRRTRGRCRPARTASSPPSRTGPGQTARSVRRRPGRTTHRSSDPASRGEAAPLRERGSGTSVPTRMPGTGSR
jgi:tetratricopeptide (TPR) repeat protein